MGVSFLNNKKVHEYRHAIGCNCIIGKYVVFWGGISSPALTLHTVRSSRHSNTNPALQARQVLNCCAIPGLLLPGRQPFKMIDVQFTL